MSQSEFIRQLCKGKTPKPKPTKEFWELLNTLYSVHNGFQKCVFEPFAQGHTGSRTKFAGTTFVTRVPFKIDLDVDKSKEQKDLFRNEGAEVTKAWNGLETVEIFEKAGLVNLM